MSKKNILAEINPGRRVMIRPDGDWRWSMVIVTATNPVEWRIQIFGLMESGCYLGPTWFILTDDTGIWKMLYRNPKGNLCFDEGSRGFAICPRVS